MEEPMAASMEGREPARGLVGCVALGVALCACGPSWSVVTDSLDRVVLSVTGSDVTIAGGGQGNGSPSLVKRLRGGSWQTLQAQGDETLWWLGAGFVVGERGALYQVSEASLDKAPVLTQATLFGVWGASNTEVWAVGGSPLGNGDNDVILRFDGTTWSRVPPPELLGVAYFKVWGSARDDVWIVGQDGLALHYDGSVWKRVTTPVRATLLTVTGRSSTDVWAVGGPPATLVHWDGTSWSEEPPPFEASGLTGVAFGPNGDLFVVGLAGTRWRRTSGKWVDDSDQPVLGDLHAVWVAPSGEAWAVGGNYIAVDAATKRRGIVAHFGRGAVPSP
jgi:hypothetical protein